MNQPIQLTVITAQRPSRLSKRFRLGSDGELLRESGGALVAGTARRVSIANLTEFAAGLESLTPAQALTYGVNGHELAGIVPKDDLEREEPHATLPLIARTRQHFHWPEGPGILMLDHDPDPAGEPWSPQRLREQLYAVWPELVGAPHLWRPSASSAIRHAGTDEEPIGVQGQRLYVAVAHAADIPWAGTVLIQRLWLAGLGRYALSMSAALLERTLFDQAVWQPERLDFCGGADCQPPLVQALPAPELFNVAATPLDTRLSLPERAQLATIKEALRTAPALLEDLQVVRTEWIDERVEKSLAHNPDADPEQLEQRRFRVPIKR